MDHVFPENWIMFFQKNGPGKSAKTACAFSHFLELLVCICAQIADKYLRSRHLFLPPFRVPRCAFDDDVATDPNVIDFPGTGCLFWCPVAGPSFVAMVIKMSKNQTSEKRQISKLIYPLL